MKNFSIALISVVFLLTACKKDETEPTPGPGNTQPTLIFKFKFDSTQVRYDNLGNISTVPAGNSAQSPLFNLMSAHYIELAQNSNTALGAGIVLFKNVSSTAGGASAIDFNQAVKKGNNEVFFSIPLDQVSAGTYEWLRVSLAYQNYDIKYKSGTYYGIGTIASFIGYNTYITSYTIKTQNVDVNGNREQGYWGFETTAFSQTYISTGQAPSGATTVPNPLFATSPIPAGSCVVTGAFVNSGGNIMPLVITGNESNDIVITVSLSTNKSFEWKDANIDGWYEPSAGDTVVDMGIRGLIPFIQ